jgi:hypothetical protein
VVVVRLAAHRPTSSNNLITLVGIVKEWEEFVLFYGLQHYTPLFQGGIYSGGVLCTELQDDD